MRLGTISGTATTNCNAVVRRKVRIDIGEPHTEGRIVGPADGVIRCCKESGGRGPVFQLTLKDR